jgi:6-pyruvoyltetrahydropterin/6-carboxytetrahydropterin synthase
MHTLSRQVRFSITPFLPAQPEGFNSYASKPTGDGLSIYLSLWAELTGELDPETGFVVNVSLIDDILRRHIVPVFEQRIGRFFHSLRPVSICDLIEILVSSVPIARSCFEERHRKKLTQLRLELNPYRSISMACDSSKKTQVKGLEMVTYTEKFEFSAMHKLWNTSFSPEKNVEAFGKCANPAGHGHNYILEVAVAIPIKPSSELQVSVNKEDIFSIVDFQKTVKTNFLDLVDHKNLNVDVKGFETLNPTVENLAFFAWKRLSGRFDSVNLCRITVWENDRTYCSYSEKE